MNPLQLHSAGATVAHTSPFAALEVPMDTGMLASELRETWVQPLYFGIHKAAAQDFLVGNAHCITVELISQLLANFDWRSRTVGAYLVAVSDKAELTTWIDRLLLRSDVCYAGAAYCFALAAINSEESIAFLEEYLSYYLSQTELWFDQAHAMAALSYLDDVNGTARAAHYGEEWASFVANKTNWNLEESIARFTESMIKLQNIRSRIALDDAL